MALDTQRLRIDRQHLHPMEADEAARADVALADAQRLAAELVDRLAAVESHAVHGFLDLPHTLSIAADLAEIVNRYVQQPYMDLCECSAPLLDMTCRICGARMCRPNDGLAPVTFGRECGRTPLAYRVAGTDNEEANVCDRHTPEERAAAGLEEWDEPLDF